MSTLPIVLEPHAFSSLLMSVVEVHGTESMGLLIGHEDSQFIKGKVTECIAVAAAYPLQSADRGRTSVGFGNLAARKRVESTVNAVGFAIVGGFHSHPNTTTKLSKEDKDFIFSELEGVYSKLGLERWLEIVVKVGRIRRPATSKYLKKLYRDGRIPEPGYYPWNTSPEIAGDLITHGNGAYRVEMKGYWFEGEKIKEALLCYSRY